MPRTIRQTSAACAPRKSGTVCACPTAADDIALMAFTSGTTGKPKAAIHFHRDVLAACECWPRHVLRATPDDIVMGSPPLAFTFGLGGMLMFPMWAGASVYFPGHCLHPEAMVDADVRSRCHHLLHRAHLLPPDGAAIRQGPAARQPIAAHLCVSAGEALPDATRQLWKEATGIEMIDGIGATEMFHIFISAAEAEVRPGAIGKVVPGYTAKVIDDDGKPSAAGTVGKLAVIGPTGCRYLATSARRSYVKERLELPGDAFAQDADGYFFYQARAPTT
jgi:2-aminobenzoate-CoA ligase